MPRSETDTRLIYAATPARLSRRSTIKGWATTWCTLEAPLARITVPDGPLRLLPAWQHPADPLHDPCVCRCAQQQGYPYAWQQPTKQVTVVAEGPLQPVVHTRWTEQDTTVETCDRTAVDLHRTSSSPRNGRRQNRGGTHLTWGTDLAPDPEPLGRPQYLSTGSAVVGHETVPERQRMATALARTSSYDPPKIPGSQWVPDGPAGLVTWTETYTDRWGNERHRTARTTALAEDAALPTSRTPMHPLESPVVVAALLRRLEANGLDGVLAYAYSEQD